MSITNPFDDVKLPGFTSIRRLKITSLSPASESWEWMGDISELEELYLEIGGKTDNSNSDMNTVTGSLDSLHIHQNKTQISTNNIQSTWLFWKVLESLPSHMRDGVSLLNLFLLSLQSQCLYTSFLPNGLLEAKIHTIGKQLTLTEKVYIQRTSMVICY